MSRRIILILAAVGGAAGAGWIGWALRSAQRGLARPTRQTQPILTDLLRAHAGRIDFADAWAAPIAPGETDDPNQWASAVIRFPDGIGRLMRLRDALVRPFGLATVMDRELPPTGFPVLAEGDRELVLGMDDKHLGFRVGVATGGGRAVITTTVTINNRLGRAYWAVVRWFHPVIVAWLLRQARVPAAAL
ncbi:MAG: DUF2867 domain-containing protein [Propionibacteriaceae bacterium]|jgi:hypothetical protein|nr:DUF2867 domain-containing protein [Propionibacteriaceae bacterium]